MQINEECIRDILKYLIENLDISVEIDNKFNYHNISVLELINSPVLSEKYLEKDIIYSINILSQCGFIEGENLQKKVNVFCSMQEIHNVTYIGQRFYETIKPEKVWEKTKGVINKVGVHTLDFIETVAHDAAVESAKQAVTIAMTQRM